MKLGSLVSAIRPTPTAPNDHPLSFFEFWPGWLFYTPVVIHWLILGLRYGDFSLPTAANPRITTGGLCGESKLSILQFPSAPQEFDGVDPIVVINNGNPTALRMTAGANTVVLTNDDVVQPLLVGYPWALNKPTDTVFPVKVETSQDSMLPNSIPFVNRPIAPNAKDTYHLSFRFGPAAAPTKSLASDVYQSFATVYPFTVNWPDRRPIGQLIAGSTAAGFSTNPRGWFNDPTVDVTTPQGIAAFQARLLAWAQSAVTILKSMNAQGMVTWDIEGEQYPQPTTYIGDPSQFSTLAPEMNGVVDQYFKTFSSAGLRIGVCIRPQQLVIPPGGGAPMQTTVADPTQLLLNKVAYAYNRWGATLFYIDSNGDPNFPISSSFFQTVAAQYPNVLLIPEHQTTSYFGFGSWYGELRGGYTGTPQSVLDLYPGAFSVIYLPDGPFQQNQSILQASANRGDIMMFRSWYTDPQNQEILSLYPTNGVAGPAPSIVTPSNNSAVNGTVNVTSSVAAGPAGIAGVQYAVDGSNVGGQVTGAPYSLGIGTQALAGGIHQLQAVAVDTIGDFAFAVSNFFVDEAPGSPPPGISFIAPVSGGMISGEVSVTASVSGSVPVATLQFTLDDMNVGPLLTLPPFETDLNTLSIPDGPHTLGITATDQANQTAQSSEPVTIENVPLAIAMVAPAAGSVVAQSVAVTASLTGNVPVIGVQFEVDGTGIGDFITAAPYAANWITYAFANGVHTLSATAFDIYGNSAVASIPVTVQNVAGASFLSGSAWFPSVLQNLTTAGSVDWVHWGLNGPTSIDRKANANRQLGALSVVGANALESYANNPVGFEWSDGAPTVLQSGNNTGVYVAGQGNGFTFSAAADTSARTLTVYTGVYKAQACLIAQLSDASAPIYQDCSVINNNGQTSAAYTLDYEAASTGQTLNVTITQLGSGSNPFSNVTLQAVTVGLLPAVLTDAQGR